MCCTGENTIEGNFTYIAFASDPNGKDFSVNRSAGGITRNYQAIYASNVALDENDISFPNYFFGRWFNIANLAVGFIVPFGQRLIFKRENAENPNGLERNDVVFGLITNDILSKGAVYTNSNPDDITDENNWQGQMVYDVPLYDADGNLIPSSVNVTGEVQSVSVGTSGTVQFVAEVNPDGVDQAVLWGAQNVAGMTLDADGLLTYNTTVPAGTYTIFAISVADNTVSGSTTITFE